MRGRAIRSLHGQIQGSRLGSRRMTLRRSSSRFSYPRIVSRCSTMSALGAKDRRRPYWLGCALWSAVRASSGSAPRAMATPHAVAVDREIPAWQWTSRSVCSAPQKIISSIWWILGP